MDLGTLLRSGQCELRVLLEILVSHFSLKQAASRQARNLLLPRPSARGSARATSDPIVVAGMFKTANGLGQSAKSCVQALRENGHDPIIVDLSDLFNQTDATSDIALDKMPSNGSGTLILHANAPETEAALYTLGLRRWHDWRIIGCWAWELTQPPPEWIKVSRYLTEVWTPSEFVTSVFREHLSIPVHTVPYKVCTPKRFPRRSMHDSSVSCLAMADGRSSFHRKNILASVRMFKSAYDNGLDAKLTLKFRNMDEYPHFKSALRDTIAGDERIDIINGSVTSSECWDLIANCDILISAHRAEGFGLHLAEAMALGRTVIATGWSGNTEFMTESNSVPLPYTLEPVEDPFRVYNPPAGSVWARVHEEAGIEALRNLSKNPDHRNEIGLNAQRDIQAGLDGAAYMKALG